jgi:hypothetical protein
VVAISKLVGISEAIRLIIIYFSHFLSYFICNLCFINFYTNNFIHLTYDKSGTATKEETEEKGKATNKKQDGEEINGDESLHTIKIHPVNIGNDSSDSTYSSSKGFNQ